MHLLNITLLLAILVFAIISYNHQVSTKKSALNKKHLNRNKHQLQHHKQHLPHYKKQTENKHSKHNKHQIQRKKIHEDKKSQRHYKQQRDNEKQYPLTPNKQHHLKHNKVHHTRDNKKKHSGHHSVKTSHQQVPFINQFLQVSQDYCPKMQHERIIQGYNVTNRNSFPYVAIYYVCDRLPTNPISYKGCQQWCGGSIISRFHILTAAHCLVDSNNRRRHPQLVVVRVGVHDLKDPEENSDRYRTTLAVQHLVIHKDYYDPYRSANDIAIIRLRDEIRFSALIQPVCINGLHFNFDFTKGNYVTLAGWGNVQQYGPLSDVLKRAELYITYYQSCSGYANETDFDFCVQNAYWHQGYVCNGDSGSGLVAADSYYNPINIIIGVLHGHASSQCGVPMVFANVSTYSNWINANTN